jgi:hypothetical protein
MEDGGWRMEDGGWRMEDGGYLVPKLRLGTRFSKLRFVEFELHI